MGVDGGAAFVRDRITQHARIGGVLRAAAFGLLMFAVCWMSISGPRVVDRVAPIWPPNGLLLSALLLLERRRWPLWLGAAWLGNTAANLVTGAPPAVTLLLPSFNLVEMSAAAGLLRAWAGRRLDTSRIEDLLRLALVAGLVCPVAASAVATLVLGGADRLGRFEAWAAADGLGAVIVTPLVLTLRDARARLAVTPLRPLGALALACLAAATAAAFATPRPLAFLILPAMLFVVFQLEVLGAAVGVVVVLVIAAVMAFSGHGAAVLAQPTLLNVALVAQLFLAALILTSFPTAAVLAQRRRLQAEVAEAAARTAELYRRARLAEEIAGVGYWRFDNAGQLVWSEAMFRLFDMDPAGKVDGRLVLRRIHPDDRAESRRLLARAVGHGEEYSHHFRLVGRDGRMRYVLAKASCERDAAGRRAAVFGTMIDITELKQAEMELRTAREAAEAATAVKSEFLANMSHELRTPLTSVLGFTRLALDQTDLTETSRGYIAKAANAGAALLSTVNDILDFSKLESGRLQIRPQPCDAVALCRETLELFSERAAEKGLALRFEARATPPALSIDPDRVRQLLLNLIGNAVKFSDAGEVAVSIDWSEADHRLAVSVRDQGAGVAKAQQALLFRRFSQVDGSSTRRHGGTGLGLAICLGLVESMGGTIGVESDLGEGACFHFAIPAAPAAAAVEADADLDVPVFPPGLRVLVADDHPANRELVRAVLVPFGAEVGEAANGAEAVRMAAQTPFDLILMDLRMPELDGLAAMRAIRAGGGPNQDAPILAFSAGADAPTGEARRRAGFDGDLSKPLLPTDLIEAVCSHARRWAPPEVREAS